MKKIPFLLLGLLMAFNIAAQEYADSMSAPIGFYTPDYNQIKSDCLASSGPLNFDQLAKRFSDIDTSMGLREMFTFYYGQSYLPDFNPYSNPDELDEVRRLLRGMTDTVQLADARKVVSLADKAIKGSPADLRAYYYRFIGVNMLLEKGEADSAAVERARWQFGMLFETLTSTGNGVSYDMAIHVVNPSHEYLIMSMYGFSMTSQSLQLHDGHSYDVFSLQSNQYGVDSLYFCIDRVMASASKMFASADETRFVDAEKKVTSVDIPLGTRFVLEMVKTKKRDSQFRVLEMTEVSDTLVSERDSLFSEPVKEGQIVGYFAPMRLYAGSKNVSDCLVFISGCKEPDLHYDTYMQTEYNSEFVTTSNEGIHKGVMMNEMWSDSLRAIRISNIRTKE